MGRGGVVVQLQQLSLVLSLLHNGLKVTGDAGVIRMADDVHIGILQNLQIGGGVGCSIHLLREHVGVNAGNDKFAQLQILLWNVQVVLMVEDIDLDPLIHPDPLHLLRQHPLAVWNKGRRAALYPRRMLG